MHATPSRTVHPFHPSDMRLVVDSSLVGCATRRVVGIQMLQDPILVHWYIGEDARKSGGWYRWTTSQSHPQFPFEPYTLCDTALIDYGCNSSLRHLLSHTLEFDINHRHITLATYN